MHRRGQVGLGDRFDLVHDQERKLSPLLGCHECLVFLKVEVVVIVVFACQKLKADPVFGIPAVDVK